MLPARHTSSAQDTMALLNCRRLPGRLNSAEAAGLLGFKEHDIVHLVGGKLLRPLGKPERNAPKYFAAVEVVARMGNPSWLSEATRVIANHWRIKNRTRREARP